MMLLSRAQSARMNGMLGRPFDVHEHGFVRVIDYMGDDSAIVQAARVSYGADLRNPMDDEKLIRYLMRHRHTSPFEMCEIKLHVKLPIFVARQWVRHRTANINEQSARYSVLDGEFFWPEEADVQAQSSSNKQGRKGGLCDAAVRCWIMQSKHTAAQSYDIYEEALQQGFARELARIGLPLNLYTQWYWKVDLHNLLHFLSLRADPHAQKEIRDYADVILHEIVKAWLPWTYQAFLDYRLNAEHMSAQEMEVLRYVMRHAHIRDWRELVRLKSADLCMSKREINDLVEKLQKEK